MARGTDLHADRVPMKTAVPAPGHCTVALRESVLVLKKCTLGTEGWPMVPTDPPVVPGKVQVCVCVCMGVRAWVCMCVREERHVGGGWCGSCNFSVTGKSALLKDRVSKAKAGVEV